MLLVLTVLTVLTNMKIAYVFPGQGSQTVGMGVDLLDFPLAKEKFAQAESILGWSVLEVVKGDESVLSRTLYTQPCLYVISAILADLLESQGKTPTLVAGHSLGEYSALYCAKVFDFESGLRLVKQRGELMDQAQGGKMAALMKFDRTALETLLQDTPDVVLANDNSVEQVVISGTPDGVDRILSQIKAKRAVPLNVSGAFHSPFMASASQEFQKVLESVNFNNAKYPVLSNVDPTPETSASQLKDRLQRQMTGGVRWREIMEELGKHAVTSALEIGPGKVLTGLLKRTCPNIELVNINSANDVNSLA